MPTKLNYKLLQYKVLRIRFVNSQLQQWLPYCDTVKVMFSCSMKDRVEEIGKCGSVVYVRRELAII